MSTPDQDPPRPKDDPFPEEVRRRAEALARAVLKLPPRPQQELVGAGEGLVK